MLCQRQRVGRADGRTGKRRTVLAYVIIPGIGGSGGAHWQTLWEDEWGSDAVRIAPASWSEPDLADWVQAIERAAGSDRPRVPCRGRRHVPERRAARAAVPQHGRRQHERPLRGPADGRGPRGRLGQRHPGRRRARPPHRRQRARRMAPGAPAVGGAGRDDPRRVLERVVDLPASAPASAFTERRHALRPLPPLYGWAWGLPRS